MSHQVVHFSPPSLYEESVRPFIHATGTTLKRKLQRVGGLAERPAYADGVCDSQVLNVVHVVAQHDKNIKV